MAIKASQLTGNGFTAGSQSAQDGTTNYTRTIGGMVVVVNLTQEGNATVGFGGTIVVNQNGDVSASDINTLSALLVTLGLVDGKVPPVNAMTSTAQYSAGVSDVQHGSGDRQARYRVGRPPRQARATR